MEALLLALFVLVSATANAKYFDDILSYNITPAISVNIKTTLPFQNSLAMCEFISLLTSKGKGQTRLAPGNQHYIAS